MTEPRPSPLTPANREQNFQTLVPIAAKVTIDQDTFIAGLVSTDAYINSGKRDQFDTHLKQSVFLVTPVNHTANRKDDRDIRYTTYSVLNPETTAEQITRIDNTPDQNNTRRLRLLTGLKILNIANRYARSDAPVAIEKIIEETLFRTQKSESTNRELIDSMQSYLEMYTQHPDEVIQELNNISALVSNINRSNLLTELHSPLFSVTREQGRHNPLIMLPAQQPLIGNDSRSVIPYSKLVAHELHTWEEQFSDGHADRYDQAELLAKSFFENELPFAKYLNTDNIDDDTSEPIRTATHEPLLPKMCELTVYNKRLIAGVVEEDTVLTASDDEIDELKRKLASNAKAFTVTPNTQLLRNVTKDRLYVSYTPFDDPATTALELSNEVNPPTARERAILRFTVALEILKTASELNENNEVTVEQVLSATFDRLNKSNAPKDILALVSTYQRQHQSGSNSIVDELSDISYILTRINRTNLALALRSEMVQNQIENGGIPIIVVPASFPQILSDQRIFLNRQAARESQLTTIQQEDFVITYSDDASFLPTNKRVLLFLAHKNAGIDAALDKLNAEKVEETRAPVKRIAHEAPKTIKEQAQLLSHLNFMKVEMQVTGKPQQIAIATAHAFEITLPVTVSKLDKELLTEEPDAFIVSPSVHKPRANTKDLRYTAYSPSEPLETAKAICKDLPENVRAITELRIGTALLIISTTEKRNSDKTPKILDILQETVRDAESDNGIPIQHRQLLQSYLASYKQGNQPALRHELSRTAELLNNINRANLRKALESSQVQTLIARGNFPYVVIPERYPSCTNGQMYEFSSRTDTLIHQLNLLFDYELRNYPLEIYKVPTQQLVLWFIDKREPYVFEDDAVAILYTTDPEPNKETSQGGRAQRTQTRQVEPQPTAPAARPVTGSQTQTTPPPRQETPGAQVQNAQQHAAEPRRPARQPATVQTLPTGAAQQGRQRPAQRPQRPQAPTPLDPRVDINTLDRVTIAAGNRGTNYPNRGQADARRDRDEQDNPNNGALNTALGLTISGIEYSIGSIPHRIRQANATKKKLPEIPNAQPNIQLNGNEVVITSPYFGRHIATLVKEATLSPNARTLEVYHDQPARIFEAVQRLRREARLTVKPTTLLLEPLIIMAGIRYFTTTKEDATYEERMKKTLEAMKASLAYDPNRNTAWKGIPVNSPDMDRILALTMKVIRNVGEYGNHEMPGAPPKNTFSTQGITQLKDIGNDFTGYVKLADKAHVARVLSKTFGSAKKDVFNVLTSRMTPLVGIVTDVIKSNFDDPLSKTTAEKRAALRNAKSEQDRMNARQDQVALISDRLDQITAIANREKEFDPNFEKQIKALFGIIGQIGFVAGLPAGAKQYYAVWGGGAPTIPESESVVRGIFLHLPLVAGAPLATQEAAARAGNWLLNGAHLPYQLAFSVSSIAVSLLTVLATQLEVGGRTAMSLLLPNVNPSPYPQKSKTAWGTAATTVTDIVTGLNTGSLTFGYHAASPMLLPLAVQLYQDARIRRRYLRLLQEAARSSVAELDGPVGQALRVLGVNVIGSY